MAGRLDHDVRAAPARARAHPGARARPGSGVCRDVEHVVRAQPARGLRGAPRARPPRARRRAPASDAKTAAFSPTGPLPCTTTVSPSAMPARSTAWKPVGSPQPPPMNVARVDAVGQRQHAHAGPQLDLLAPAAEQAVGRGGGDAVHAPVRAARGRACDQAVPAGAADAEHVVERDEAPDLDRPALDVGERPVRLQHPPAADVPGDDRVGHAREAAVVQVHVGAAHLRQHHLQHGAARRGPRLVEGVQRERPTRPLHHDRADAHRDAVFGSRRSLPSGKW